LDAQEKITIVVAEIATLNNVASMVPHARPSVGAGEDNDVMALAVGGTQ